MGAYICDICGGMFCHHEVNYYSCDKCNKQFCEDCWCEYLSEEQEGTENICGECYGNERNEESAD